MTDKARIVPERISDRFLRIRMSFGYMETPNVPKALRRVRREGKSFDIMSTSFFVNRGSFRSAPAMHCRRGRSDFYRLPSNRTIMRGQRMTL